MLVPYVLVALQTIDRAAVSPAHLVRVNEILCENPRYAMDFAAALSNGDESEVAKDVVGKEAQREVCGRFIGLAVAERTSVATSDGVVYRLVAFRFKEDNRVGWLAQTSFAPPESDDEVPL